MSEAGREFHLAVVPDRGMALIWPSMSPSGQPLSSYWCHREQALVPKDEALSLTLTGQAVAAKDKVQNKATVSFRYSCELN